MKNDTTVTTEGVNIHHDMLVKVIKAREGYTFKQLMDKALNNLRGARVRTVRNYGLVIAAKHPTVVNTANVKWAMEGMEVRTVTPEKA
jgi:hypothetical protein